MKIQPLPVDALNQAGCIPAAGRTVSQLSVGVDAPTFDGARIEHGTGVVPAR